ncbi:hypothetical protein [Chitinimonas sp. BJYL2]|nr:hypothetical protein [Chitinimonas sp. BJYL2]
MFSPFTLARRTPVTPAQQSGKVIPLRQPQPAKPEREPAVRIA